MSWDQFVTRRLLEPLEMTSTVTDRKTISPERLALRHRLYDGEVALLRTPDSDRMAAAGAMHSTINDLASWMMVQLQEGEFHGKRLISQSAIREMQAVQQSLPVKWRPTADAYDARFAGTGLGWFIRDFRGRKVIQHGGGMGSRGRPCS
jgi:CubicO group peptidase (beta-lactamase class C family)